MKRIGLIAGGGSLPVEFVHSVKDKGDKIIVFALEGIADDRLEACADKVYRLGIGEYKKFAFLLLKERIKSMALIGKVDKSVMYSDTSAHDREYTEAVNGLPDRKDYSVLGEVTRHLERFGVNVIDGFEYLSHLIPGKGLLGNIAPDEDMENDIKFGFETAKKLAGMDIGQTVIIKRSAVVAVEAMEGTDRTIARAKDIAGDNCIMVKVSRPGQDMRWDVPTIGPETVKNLINNKFAGLVLESGTMYIVDRENVVGMADSEGIFIQAV